MPPAVIGALAALAADGPVALAGLVVAVAVALAAAGFAAVDIHHNRRRGEFITAPREAPHAQP